MRSRMPFIFLTVLTGETGAGKTMVLTALGLVLGNKSDSDLVRQGEERAIVTGKFAVPKELAAQIIDAGGGQFYRAKIDSPKNLCSHLARQIVCNVFPGF